MTSACRAADWLSASRASSSAWALMNFFSCSSSARFRRLRFSVSSELTAASCASISAVSSDDELFARAHELSLGEVDRRDAPVALRPDHHRLVGEQRPDRAHFLADGAGLHRAHLDRHGRPARPSPPAPAASARPARTRGTSSTGRPRPVRQAPQVRSPGVSWSKPGRASVPSRDGPWRGKDEDFTEQTGARPRFSAFLPPVENQPARRRAENSALSPTCPARRFPCVSRPCRARGPAR